MTKINIITNTNVVIDVENFGPNSFDFNEDTCYFSLCCSNDKFQTCDLEYKHFYIAVTSDCSNDMHAYALFDELGKKVMCNWCCGLDDDAWYDMIESVSKKAVELMSIKCSKYSINMTDITEKIFKTITM